MLAQALETSLRIWIPDGLCCEPCVLLRMLSVLQTLRLHSFQMQGNFSDSYQSQFSDDEELEVLASAGSLQPCSCDKLCQHIAAPLYPVLYITAFCSDADCTKALVPAFAV